MRTMVFRNKKDEWPVLARFLSDGCDFRNSNGSMRGSAHPHNEAAGWGSGTGRLCQRWREVFLTLLRSGGPQDAMVYVVYSYRTPIAWYTPTQGWTVPAEHYSQTTTGHQNLVRLAVDTYRDRLHTKRHQPSQS
ncbi:hypothetical protein GCM10009765_03320 [Fodinicola feengrottensis]|uniref:DUF8033 domain-containing protein n=1 Tax=Fodinicola feengrottensis TaxID=435914 RepID=A0ABN2FR78_9ACTN